MDPNNLKKLQNFWEDLVRWRKYLSTAFPGQELAEVPEHLRKIIRDLEHVEGFETPPHPSPFPLEGRKSGAGWP
jgi:hypothetical protein